MRWNSYTNETQFQYKHLCPLTNLLRKSRTPSHFSNGQRETENTLFAFSCFLHVFQTVKEEFYILGGPFCNLLRLIVMGNTAKKQAQSLKRHCEQFLDSAWLYSQNEDFLNLSFLKSFSTNRTISLLKAKSSFQEQSMHTVGGLSVCP